ncbi:MAG: TonB-dependent receptor [Burkholderiales bacterium]
MLLASAQPAYAQANRVLAAAELPKVVVTATRGESRVDQLVADVTVLTRADIERAQGHTLAEFLGMQAGIQSSSNGGPGQTDAIYLRGLEGRHTLLLVDGMRLGSATTGEPTLSNLPLADIERIEIVRGPLASLYGSDAVAGVVQVFTRRAREQSVANGSISAGRYGQVQATAGWAGTEGPWSLAFQVAHDEASGFSATNPRNTFSYNPDSDGYNRNSGSARVGLRLGGDWQAQARLFSSESLNDYDDGPGPSATFRQRNQVGAADVGGTVLPGWKTKLSLGRSRDGYNAVSVSSPFSQLGEIATTQRQVSLENNIATPVGNLLVLGEQLHQNVDKPGLQNYSVRERRVNALGLGLNGDSGAHLWQLSGRRDQNSQYGAQKTGSAGYGWRFMPGWTVGGQVGSAFVAPSFNDLYWPNDGFGQGNPNLRPSRSRNAELSLGFKQNQLQAKVTAHRARVTDLIQWVETPPGSFFYVPSNVARAAVDGITLQGQVPLAGLLWQGSVDHLNARDQDTGKELARRARNVARLGADRQAGEWRYGASLAGYSGRWSDAANTSRLSGYAVLDLRTDWQFQRDWSVGARLNNALDRHYETALGYNQPGRALMVTLRYQGH